MVTALVVDDTRLEEIYAQLRALIRELDPDLSDDDVEAALTRMLYYAERERRLKREEEGFKDPSNNPKKKPG